MQAIILAAGMGKRLQSLTNDNTKCMVKVNGITLIERMLNILDKKNLSKIIIVIGYKGQKLIDYIATLNIETPIIYINNTIYDKTNNIYSLSMATPYLIEDDTLLFESDLIFEESIVDSILEDKRESLALVDKYEAWMDGTCMILDQEDNITDFIPGKYIDFSQKENYYKTVNIYKFSKNFSNNTYVPFLAAYKKAMGNNEYYEAVIKLIAMLDHTEIKAKRLVNQKWYEIDDIQDLNIASSIFLDSEEERYHSMMSRFGGFWRYPKLLDFCYLVNPYFPPEKMKNEIISNFDTLLTEYPSGMSINNLLAARNFNVKQEHIIVGNGAAELIKELLELSTWGTLGVIRPTFEEYPNRYETNKIVTYTPSNSNFSYTEKDLINYFDHKNIDTLLLINPDNPSGNYIPKKGIYSLIDWAKQKNISIIIDESFVDFANENIGFENTIINESTLSKYNKLFIIKSISKSYGVPGIRLGILASSNEDIINQLNKNVSIWNINSFGEFFMQIYEKYTKDYIVSLEKIKKSRTTLINSLSKISYLHVLPSEANYVMCELLKNITSKQLAAFLLNHDILIKDLTNKISNNKEYIRLAVRNNEDNNLLISKLKEFENKIT